jgi:3'-phosphoadenosine 5'-phosphosulfate sulfotransferase (PAPS reductase)/FAD synthetase
MPATYHLPHLRTLEAEAVHVMREVAAEFERPVLLFSGGKDSIVLLRLAEKAFRPGGFPFPVMHVDTGHNLPEADEFGQWEPQRQRPEVWSLYNGRICRGEHARVFSISNWTELDVWQYIAEETLEVPSIYYAHEREVFARDGMLYAVSPFVELIDGERSFSTRVRYRTVGDMSCTGAVESSASTLEEVVAEIAATEVTERGQTRGDDRVSEAAMEDRKRQGYL